VWIDGPQAGAVNMARDHALAESLEAGHALLRFYTWARPTVSLGRNEPGRGLWDLDRLAVEGIDLVRRPTGGRAVFHHRELTYAVVAPAEGPGSMRALYRSVNDALVVGLARFGVPAVLAPRRGRAASPGAGPCFREPAEGEIVVEGRKLVGSAQVRLGHTLLQHGSLLVEDDQDRLHLLQRGPRTPGLDVGVTCLADWVDVLPDMAQLANTLASVFSEVIPGDWHALEGGPNLNDALESRLEAHYRSPEWTWRR
jgi:lipoate-protein ligase A